MQLDRSTASETDRTQTNTAQRIRLVASRVLRGCNPYFDNTVILQTYKVPQGVNGSGKVPERLPDGASKRYLDFVSGTVGHRSTRLETRVFAAALGYAMGLSADEILRGIDAAPPVMR